MKYFVCITCELGPTWVAGAFEKWHSNPNIRNDNDNNNSATTSAASAAIASATTSTIVYTIIIQ